MYDFEHIPAVSELVDDAFRKGASPVLDRLDQKIKLQCILQPAGFGSTEDTLCTSSLQMASFLKAFTSLTQYCEVEFHLPGEDPRLEEILHCHQHYPATGLFLADGTYSGISFLGIPGGKEINSFLLAIYNLAGPGQPTDPDITKKVSCVHVQKDISVLVSLSCHHCADTVIAAMRLASLNPLISARMIDARLFPDLIEQYHLERVPVILLNGEAAAIGGKDISEILDLLV